MSYLANSSCDAVSCQQLSRAWLGLFVLFLFHILESYLIFLSFFPSFLPSFGRQASSPSLKYLSIGKSVEECAFQSTTFMVFRKLLREAGGENPLSWENWIFVYSFWECSGGIHSPSVDILVTSLSISWFCLWLCVYVVNGGERQSPGLIPPSFLKIGWIASWSISFSIA